MRVVCFDLGGVLVEINYRWKGALLDCGLPEAFAERFDCLLTDFEPFNGYQRGAMSLDRYLSELAAYFEGLSAECALEVHNAVLRSAYPRVPELIQELHEHGIETGCLSNTNAAHWEAFYHEPRLAVLKEVRFPIGSHLFGAEKPDPAMYRAFEEASGAKPEEIVYFDDGAANVEAARALGWNAFAVDPQNDPASQMRTELRKLGWL